MSLAGTKTDTIVLLFSSLAVFIAGTLSMATIATNSNTSMVKAKDPTILAEEAANYGTQAASWHIECHGRYKAGGLSQRYHINGAIYSVEWGDVDLNDSTVVVQSRGIYYSNDKREYSVELESKVKLDLIQTHSNGILEQYYSNQLKYTTGDNNL